MEIVMNKTKVEIYREVLWDVSQNFKGSENLLNREQIKYVNERKKLLQSILFLHIFWVLVL